jgi:hypothetical protein
MKIHDLLQQLAQDIVCQECMSDPRKRIRLWILEDVLHVYINTSSGMSLDLICFRHLCSLSRR